MQQESSLKIQNIHFYPTFSAYSQVQFQKNPTNKFREKFKCWLGDQNCRIYSILILTNIFLQKKGQVFVFMET